jgi:hypothetical protein
MATEAEHHAKYAECRAVLNGLPALITISGAWAATVAFYAAVHLVERLAARDNRHHTRHSGLASRNSYVTSHPNHRVVASDFMALYTALLVARYDPPTAFALAYPGDTVKTQLIDGCLARIETYVAGVFPSSSPSATGS